MTVTQSGQGAARGDSPRASVIIPNWNGQAHLQACLRALEGQSFRDFEIVVADNGSTDGSAGLVREHPEIGLIELGRNVGFSRAINAGIRNSVGKYVSFLNNDTEPEPTWLEELVGCLERHPDAASVTSKLVRLDDPRMIDDAGDVMTGYLKAYQRGNRERDLGQYDDEVQVFSASGAACLWRRAALERIGLLDESFFAYYEDVDLGFRARLAGYECWYAPRAVVRHAGAGTSSLSSEFVYFHSVKNRWGMILKDVPAPLLVRNALKIVFGELLALAWCVREGHLHFMLGAYKEILGSLRPLLAKRRQVQASRTISLAELDAVINPKYPPPRSHRALLRLLQ